MRVAALYDIHGNLPALEAVLEEARQTGVDQIVVGGDVVLGPLPRETLARLQSVDIPVSYIRGNADREVAAQMAGATTSGLPERVWENLRWVARQMKPDEGKLLEGWPLTLRLNIEGLGDVLFCHATPCSDTPIFTRITPNDKVRPLLEGVEGSVVVCGHTHMQFDRTVDGIRVVNAGSVGMPYGEPGAYWLLLGPDVEFRRTRYDLARAAERIRATEYPMARDFAANNVLQPPSEEEALKVFSPND